MQFVKLQGYKLFFVTPAGKMSNFLEEDFDAVLNFMNAEVHKKKLKL